MMLVSLRDLPCVWLAATGWLLALAVPPGLAEAQDRGPSIYAKDNLVAWCIVPFDAAKRSPSERAAMIRRLGLKRVAYDWRDQHVPEFEEEIRQYHRNGIEYFAFWGWHASMQELIAKHGIRPQLWIPAPSPEGDSQDMRVNLSARDLTSLAETARQLDLKLGLYNHGGWGGDPDNLLAVCQELHEQGHEHVGIVYNFHHAHAHVDKFDMSIRRMKPYLLCVNLNGMNDDENPKILPIGSGRHEQRMMRSLRESGYRGPVGIIHHREELDAETGLRQNLNGLKTVLRAQADTAALTTYDESP